MIATVFSVSALREPVVRFFVEVYEKFSMVFIHHEEEQFPATLEVYYAPTWLPEEYQENLGQMVDAIIFCERVFTNDHEGEIRFKQKILTSKVLHIDTEDVQSRPLTVNGAEGLFFSNKGIQNLIWNDGQYGYHILGPVSEADLLRIAESIQPLE